MANTGLFVRIDLEDSEEPIRRELRLHRAVLDRALLDCFSVYKDVRKDVNKWLDLNNVQFQDACDRAMLKPEDVLEVFHSLKRMLKGKNAKFKQLRKKKKKNKT